MDQMNNDASPKSPPKSPIEALDYELQITTWSLENLKVAAIQHKLVRPRSLAWAFLLNTLPPHTDNIIKSIRTHRNFYNDLKSKLSMDPRAVLGDDPLSQNDESAWKQHFCDNELKALIMQDVMRTFPDEVYFRDKEVQDTMVRVLFFWARSHSNVGYRQGMHEILAPLLFELYTDRKYAPDCLSDSLKYYLDDSFLEHDSYMLFNAVMKGIEKFYTTGDAVPSSCGRLPTSKLVHNPNEVVRYLERVRQEYLIPLDAELAAHLADCNITMELFGIRWLRLLFGREFPRSEIPHLWGFLFADGPTLPYLHYVIVAMLIAIRSTLLDPDPGAVLSALMRPSPAAVGYVCALARHLRRPLDHPPPPPPPPPHHQHHHHSPPRDLSRHSSISTGTEWEQRGAEAEAEAERRSESGSEGVAEGADVARELAALALVRAQLPQAAAQLALALPRPPPAVAQPLQQILQLAALIQCRNHALIDVETALEAAEGQNTDKVGRRQLVPVSMMVRRAPAKQNKQTQVNKVKEVQLKVFHQAECVSASDLPCLDPLRLRTE